MDLEEYGKKQIGAYGYGAMWSPTVKDSHQSPDISSLADAFVKAQASISAPPKNREVKVRQRAGGEYSFRYTTLDKLIEHVRKPLTDNGLWFLQRVTSEDGKLRIITTLLHSSGQYISSTSPVPVDARAGAQEIGSALTYMKRYSLAAMLGLESDEDDDANRAVGNDVEDKTPKKAQKGSPKTEKTIIDKIQGCETTAQLNKLWRYHKDFLDDLEKSDTESYGRILKAATEKKTELNGDK